MAGKSWLALLLGSAPEGLAELKLVPLSEIFEEEGGFQGNRSPKVLISASNCLSSEEAGLAIGQLSSSKEKHGSQCCADAIELLLGF